jgi:integrase
MNRRKLFAEIPEHLRTVALFKVNTGCRDAEVCGLRWEWEMQVPEPRNQHLCDSRRSGEERGRRLMVLNSVARSIVESQRGVHPGESGAPGRI